MHGILYSDDSQNCFTFSTLSFQYQNCFTSFKICHPRLFLIKTVSIWTTWDGKNIVRVPLFVGILWYILSSFYKYQSTKINPCFLNTFQYYCLFHQLSPHRLRLSLRHKNQWRRFLHDTWTLIIEKNRTSTNALLEAHSVKSFKPTREKWRLWEKWIEWFRILWAFFSIIKTDSFNWADIAKTKKISQENSRSKMEILAEKFQLHIALFSSNHFRFSLIYFVN